MALRHYNNTAQPTTLSAGATDSATTLTVVSTAGFPTVPFTIGVDRGTADEEAMLVTAVTSTTMTVTRGYNGTTAVAHNSGASVEHCIIALDASEANGHIENTARDDHTQYLNVTRAKAYFPKTFSGTAANDVTISTNYAQCNSVTIPSATFDRKVQLSAICKIVGEAGAVYVARISRSNTAYGAGEWYCSNTLYTNSIPVLTDWISLPSGSAYTFALQVKRYSGSGGETVDDANFNKITAITVPDI